MSFFLFLFSLSFLSSFLFSFFFCLPSLSHTCLLCSGRTRIEGKIHGGVKKSHVSAECSTCHEWEHLHHIKRDGITIKAAKRLAAKGTFRCQDCIHDYKFSYSIGARWTEAGLKDGTRSCTHSRRHCAECYVVFDCPIGDYRHIVDIKCPSCKAASVLI